MDINNQINNQPNWANGPRASAFPRWLKYVLVLVVVLVLVALAAYFVKRSSTSAPQTEQQTKTQTNSLPADEDGYTFSKTAYPGFPSELVLIDESSSLQFWQKASTTGARFVIAKALPQSAADYEKTLPQGWSVIDRQVSADQAWISLENKTAEQTARVDMYSLPNGQTAASLTFSPTIKLSK